MAWGSPHVKPQHPPKLRSRTSTNLAKQNMYLRLSIAFYMNLNESLEVLWRWGNVPRHVWDFLELFYIEFLIQIYKNTSKHLFSGMIRPQNRLFGDLTIRIDISRQDPYFYNNQNAPNLKHNNSRS